MTKAKRYEGERLRAEEWHNMGRDKAWDRKRAGMREIEPIVRNKFNVWCETRYDPMECGYLIVVEVGPGGPYGPEGELPILPSTLIFRHEEPALEFPSEHLKAKLILLAG